MKTTLRWTLSVGLVLASGFTGLSHTEAAASSETSPAITIHVGNYAGVAPQTFAEAEEVATQILRQAGVRAVWLDCSPTVATGQRQPLCDRPLEPTDLILNFAEEIQSLSPNLRENTLGFALIPGGGGQGDRAYISNRRVHKTARRFETSSAMILGLAAAHEIGHLLMESGDHSPSGLMRAGWDFKDIRRAAKGDLRFTDDQVKQVHAGALAREVADR